MVRDLLVLLLLLNRLLRWLHQHDWDLVRVELVVEALVESLAYETTVHIRLLRKMELQRTLFVVEVLQQDVSLRAQVDDSVSFEGLPDRHELTACLIERLGDSLIILQIQTLRHDKIFVLEELVHRLPSWIYEDAGLPNGKLSVACD